MADRVERAALVDAVARLASGGITGLAVREGEKVIGGKVTPTASPAIEQEPIGVHHHGNDVDEDSSTETVIDLRELEGAEKALHDPVEVRCRFGDRWVDGFEICEVSETDGTLRYRLRRCSDGYVLPTLFVERDVRPIEPLDLHRGPLVLHPRTEAQSANSG